MQDIIGYEGIYAITEDGKVWNYKYKRWMKPDTHPTGHQMVALHKNGVCKGFYVHRLVATQFIPNPDNLPCVNHKDENPANNNVDNLEWCTRAYNNNYGTRNQRMAASLTGKKQSEETKQKRAASIRAFYARKRAMADG